MTHARLILKDGSCFRGFSFGAEKTAFGEVVFNTGMVGYPESLTDPSYAGQILTFTYPLIGNYGVPPHSRGDFGILNFFESNRIQVRGLVVSEYCTTPSHWNSVQTLDSWLKKENIPGIFGIDTRALTKKLRSKGVMNGKIIQGSSFRIPNSKIKITNANANNLINSVSIKEKIIYKKGSKRVLFVDCGAKNNIIRSLIKRNITIIRVPWNYDFSKERYSGILISNGPGDPSEAKQTIKNIRAALKKNKPILGICLGNQILALAAGAKTYKLKFGHRSQNQPCLEIETKRCFITSQNHGYAVDEKTIPKDWRPWFTNANDQSNEGIKHRKKPFMAVQFHPEATPGPEDTGWIFDEFVKRI